MGRKGKDYYRRKELATKARAAKTGDKATASTSSKPTYTNVQEDYTTLELRNKLIKEVGSACPESPQPDEGRNNIILSQERLLNFANALMDDPICAVCQARIEVSVVTRFGDTSLKTVCVRCKHVMYEDHPYSVTEKLTENSVKIVYFTLQDGSGFSGCKLLSSTSNLKPPSSRAYYDMLNNVGGVIETFQEQNRATMIGSVFKYYENMRIVPDENGILDVEVSFDGSWLNRGHKSHIGFGGVIEAFTGFVLDFEILSNICIECKRMETKKKKQNLDEAAYESLKKKHEPNCRCNFVGLSGAMEKEGAVRGQKQRIK